MRNHNKSNTVRETPGPGYLARNRARRCQQLRADGRRCRAMAQSGKDCCIFHDPERAQQAHDARRAGGITRSTRAAVLPERTPDLTLATGADVSILLAQTINQVRRGQLDPRIGNAVGYLASVLLKAQESTDLEQRLAQLEHCLHEQAQILHNSKAITEAACDCKGAYSS